MTAKRACIIGGGFFGCYLAETLAHRGYQVVVLEKEGDLMGRASYVNQARVHGGYHYPRSVLTAYRSNASFHRFTEEFTDCIDRDFRKYYLVGRFLSKVSARQYELFFKRLGIFLEPAPYEITKLINPHYVEAAYTAIEYAFDAVKLKEVMRERLARASVEIRFNTRAERVEAGGGKLLVEITEPSGKGETIANDLVLNCTYAMLNTVPARSGIELISVKHEITEMCLVEVPEELKQMGITVMCGPFFSVMPFPSARLHSFSHVRYTPHTDWEEGPGKLPEADAHEIFDKAERRSHWHAMRADAARYLPLLADCEYRKSIWEVKTVLPRCEVDDARPILFHSDHGYPGFYTILGGKIDNIYDAAQILDEVLS